MIRPTLPAIAVFLLPCLLSTCGPSGGNDGWTLLFDGTSSEHWRGFRSETMPEGWVVEDGCLLRKDGGGDVITRSQWDDFELELEWKIAPGGNSGIFFHVTEDHDYTWETGPEMQILDNAAHNDGKNTSTSAGSNYALHAPIRDMSNPAGEWNAARITCRDGHVEYWLNGTMLLAYDLWSDDWNARVAASKFDAMPDYGQRKRGHIALQDHGDLVWFRNIRIRK